MLFNEEDYKKYIETIESLIILKYGLLIIVISIVGFFIFKIIGAIIGLIIGIILYYFLSIREKIKIEEMKMKVDIYEILKKKE